ncbi:AAA domain-containing protein, putative AbiEii toxin, Type IV TA system [Butyrivibrio proteoclasticus]|uniref:AAA domain-containing protein, putative AbiEii toxin, Type IV TA system n=1 Tax=Butyrivibrio proteoclasticus TaxID=43305 RepID=A0A1I5PVW5_9FIRM|nr:ATP-binding protein [Butyrivibrio proteoclasticus]SFP38248.1 AAA domain-containing protein, putative AbiEii toxin, Type IV TA system [Butyrivibrio proteoclasticus]
MRLRLTNFAKISDAEINIDGIAIIVGPNNSGKSTVGKAIDAVFASVTDIKGKMRTSKLNMMLNGMAKVLDSTGLEELPFGGFDITGYTYGFLRQLTDKMTKDEIKGVLYQKIDTICNEYFFEMVSESDAYLTKKNQIIDDLANTIKSVMDVSDDVYERRIITNNFDSMFNGNINNIANNQPANLTIYIKDKEIRCEFQNNICNDFKSEVVLKNKAFYIDNPFVIDRLNTEDSNFVGMGGQPSYENRLYSRMLDDAVDDSDKALREILADKKTNDIISVLNKVIPGKILRRQKYEYEVPEKGFLDIRSLSTGLKSFAIIKRLIDTGIMNDKDVVILDEPEIHLHPEWQKVYAELVVLLQKCFDFHIIVTTHSSKFLRSLEFYSRKHAIANRCNYYISNIDPNGDVSFSDTTANLNEIYKHMVKPSMDLDLEEEEWESWSMNG